MFALPTLTLDKDEMNSLAMYLFLDMLPVENTCCYVASGKSFVKTYLDYLCCLSFDEMPDQQAKIAKAFHYLETEKMDITTQGKTEQVPLVGIENQHPLYRKEVVDFSFSSNEWKEDPVTVNGRAISENRQMINYDFQVELVGMRFFEIKRGKWFDKELLNPSYPFLEGGMLTKKNFWGPQGDFCLLPQKVLTVEKIQIDLKMKMSTLKAARSSFAAVEDYSFLGFPVEMKIPEKNKEIMVKSGRLLGKSAMEEFKKCFPEEKKSISILGVTSERVI